MKERWKWVKGCRGKYTVSTKGRLRSVARFRLSRGGCVAPLPGRFLKQAVEDFYCSVVLCKNAKTKKIGVHRLVGLTFIPNPLNKPEINHIDCNPSNNNIDILNGSRIRKMWIML